MRKIECIIMDWAGTAVDYGCFAPVAAFIDSFADNGISITAEQARRPMGLTKIDHVRALLDMDEVSAEFREKYGRAYTDADVQTLYASFEKRLFATLAEYTDPIPGVIDTLGLLRKNGIKIGSTTGFTREMMETVVPAAAAKGYEVDNWVTSDNLPAGRPQPYMIYKNMCDLAIASPLSVVKYGDTVADVKEGRNAGVWTVGVVLGSNEMGLTETQTANMEREELCRRMREVRKRLYEAGAHYVLDTIYDLPDIVDIINTRMAAGC